MQGKVGAGEDRLLAETMAEDSRSLEARKRLDEKFAKLNRSLPQKRLEVRRSGVELSKLERIDLLQYLRLVIQTKQSVRV